MRLYGRVPDPFPPSGVEYTSLLEYGNYKWVVVETDCVGDDSYVHIAALIQCLRLNLQESPFFAQFGIPAQISVLMQSQPDYYVNFIRQFFAQFFASLIISKRPQVPTTDNFVIGGESYQTPIYDISVIRKNGSRYQTKVAL